MDQSLEFFLESTRVKKTEINNRLVHPITQIQYPPRLVFELLKNYAKDFFTSGSEPRFISLAGIRGVGKTTLLWQTANYIHQNHEKDVYFFNVNTLKNLNVTLHIALQEFQKKILKKRFSELTQPITILFDEVHDDDDWSKTLKILYDEARYVFILCTGSSALLLNQTADLARRMRIEKIYPYKFSEFMTAVTTLKNKDTIFPIKYLSEDLKEALFYSETPESALSKIKPFEDKIAMYYENIIKCTNTSIKELVNEYINYQNIPNFLFHNNKYTINDSIMDLFKRVIIEDIPKLKTSYTEFSNIERLILRLAGSDEINPEKLAKILGIKKDDINELINILAKAELLNVLLPYGGLDTKIVKNRKAFFMSPSLRRALITSLYGQSIPNHYLSKFIEDIVVMYLKNILNDGLISFTSGFSESNPDFVIETRDKPIILEIGSRKTSTRQIKLSQINYRFGLLVTNGSVKITLRDDILILPLNLFLLL